MTDTDDRVKKLMIEHLAVDAEKVTADANLIDDLGADSLDVVELVMTAEEEFDIQITDDEAEPLHAGTVGDWIALIAQKQCAS